MTIPRKFGFYGILTEPVVGYEKLASIMAKSGVRFIQLRMKDAPRKEIVQTAKSLMSVIDRKAWFIVNDDPLIAREAGADGVHLGQDDMPYEEARKILGPEAIIGLSTHNPEQTRAACALNPDYIGVGPVFATPTKKNPDPAIGIEGMKEMLFVATVSAVVLGGIDHSNAGSVLAAGASNICAVRCINQSRDPDSELKKMIEAIEEYSGR